MEHDRPRTRQTKSGFLLKYLQGLCQSVHSVPGIVIAIKQGFQSVFISDKYTMKLHRTHTGQDPCRQYVLLLASKQFLFWCRSTGQRKQVILALSKSERPISISGRRSDALGPENHLSHSGNLTAKYDRCQHLILIWQYSF